MFFAVGISAVHVRAAVDVYIQWVLQKIALAWCINIPDRLALQKETIVRDHDRISRTRCDVIETHKHRNISRPSSVLLRGVNGGSDPQKLTRPMPDTLKRTKTACLHTPEADWVRSDVIFTMKRQGTRNAIASFGCDCWSGQCRMRSFSAFLSLLCAWLWHCIMVLILNETGDKLLQRENSGFRPTS